MQASYPPQFQREYGCTEADWLRWLPGAVGGHRLEIPARGRAQVAIGEGQLALSWQPLPPRKIALAEFPRQEVGFRFEGVEAAQRHAFMRYFDLYLQRGGG